MPEIPVLKSKPKRKKSISEVNRENFREYLSQYATDNFNPSEYAMTIFDSCKKAITGNLPLQKCIVEGMLIDELGRKADEAFSGHYEEIENTVKNILE